jgi:acetylornithine deacetylase/succinyl-diaminopimelate desuccinylase-like protein
LEFIDLCKKIIRIDSTPSVGNASVALFCADLCKQAGLNVTLQEGSLDGKKQYNLLARPQKSSKKNEVIFQTHLDTVEPGPMGNWTKTGHNPFEAHIEDGRIYGLGTTDVKLDFLCKLRALKQFANDDMKAPFVLVGTFGEEVGMHGAQQLMKTKAVDATKAIIGEPSELQIVYANNGYLVVDFSIPFSEEEKKFRATHDENDNITTQEKIFRGKAAHSSTPHLGDNAIYKLISYLEKMPEGIAVIAARGGSAVNTVPADAHVEVDASTTFANSAGTLLVKVVKHLQKLERDFMSFDDKQFSPSHPTVNVGILETEANGLTLKVSFRITPQIDEALVEKWITQMKEFAKTLKIDFMPERLSPSALTPLDSELVRGAVEISKHLGLPSKPITKASGTECSVYRKFGIECIVFGPGVSIGNSHTANEYNILTQLDQATEFYAAAVKRFCL